MAEDDETASDADSYYPPWERRGTDLGRLLSLSDGIFAFALTLLVLSLALPAIQPGSPPTLWGRLTSPSFQSAMESYALVFLVLASYWRGHNLVFTYLREWYRNLVQLNFLFLGLLVLQPFLVTVISQYPGNFQAVALYAGVSAFTGLALYALWGYSAHHRRLTTPHIDDAGVRWLNASLLATPLVFGASVLVALRSPAWAEYSWVSVFVLQTLLARRFTRGPRSPLEDGPS